MWNAINNTRFIGAKLGFVIFVAGWLHFFVVSCIQSHQLVGSSEHDVHTAAGALVL